MTDVSTENSKVNSRLRVYYDGLCPLCSREISFYRTKDSAGEIAWIDITADGFDPLAEGLDPLKVRQVFHVKDESGHLIVGVDAFIEIWGRIPSLRNWKRMAALPGAQLAMKLGYAVFAKVRPYLPRKARGACSSDSCSVQEKELK